MNNIQPGMMLGPYQIINQLGQGGMATVFKAYHAAMDRYVALKIVSSALINSPELLERFKREVHLIAKLEHPHILPVHDFGEYNGIPYMVMRLVDAGTLKERLSTGPMSLEEINRVFSDLADALAYAHENGVVHRDIKPSNAMLDRLGTVFLTDFGIAKLLESQTQLTITGTITGTPAYMSPEQAQGKKVDQRSDIYSLGIVLFEMLTGKVPFEAETPLAVIIKQIQDPPPPLSHVNPHLFPGIEPVLLKALTKDPVNRYQTMLEFQQAWKRAYADAIRYIDASTRLEPPTTQVEKPPFIPARPAKETPSKPPMRSPQVADQPPSGDERIHAQPTGKPQGAQPLHAQQGPPAPVNQVSTSAGTKPLTPPPGSISVPPGALHSMGKGAMPPPPPGVLETGSLTGQPKKRENIRKLWIALGAVGVVMCMSVCLCAGVRFLNNNRRLASQRQDTPTVESLSSVKQPTNTLPPAAVALPGEDSTPTVSIDVPNALLPAPGVGSWTSWTGANWITSILAGPKDIFAAGEGGVTIWSPADGSYSQISVLNGLPSAWVNSVYQDDQQGGLWFATENGLAYQSDSTWTIYNHQNQSIDSDYVKAVTRYDGKLWVGTEYAGEDGKGLQYFDGQSWYPVTNYPSTIEAKPDTVSDNVNVLLADTNGRLWVATTDGLGMYDGSVWTVFDTPQGLPNSNILSLLEDKDGGIWAGVAWEGQDTSGAARFDGASFQPLSGLVEHGAYDIYGMLQDNDGNLWFAASDIIKYNPARDNWTTYTPYDGSLPVSAVYAAAKGEDGTLYFGTLGEGVLLYRNDVFNIWKVNNAPRFADYGRIVPMPGAKLAFVELYEGNFDIFDPAQRSWEKPGEEEWQRAIPRVTDTSGRLWSGSGNGVWIISSDGQAQLTSGDGLPSDSITDISHSPDGTAWISTEKGLAEYNGSQITQVFTAKDHGLVDEYIAGVMAASDRSVWIWGYEDFSRRAPDGTWEHFSPDSLFGGFPGLITGLAEDQNGNIWIGTYYDGAYRYSDGNWDRFLSTDTGVNLPSDTIYCITAAPGGLVWFGTSDGVAVFDGTDWSIISSDAVLVNLSVNGIYVESNGVIWFSANGGISRWEP